MTVRLVKDGHGGYSTPDGRWTITPVDGMGAGVNNNGGWSTGKRVWRVTDTHGVAALSTYGDPHSALRDRLWEVRDLIAECNPLPTNLPDSPSARYVIRTESRGDGFFVKSEVGLDLRLRVSLSVTPEDATFGSREHAERWGRKVARHDPTLRLEVVAL